MPTVLAMMNARIGSWPSSAWSPVLNPCTSRLKMTRATIVAAPPTARNRPTSAMNRWVRSDMRPMLSGSGRRSRLQAAPGRVPADHRAAPPHEGDRVGLLQRPGVGVPESCVGLDHAAGVHDRPVHRGARAYDGVDEDHAVVDLGAGLDDHAGSDHAADHPAGDARPR